MAELKSTKYPDNIRIVTGVVDVFPDDVILLCNTAAGPVTINLLGIPNGYWSTQYKLYVIDNSGNASVNNITINAGNGVDSNNVPVPQKINAASSVVLNTNYGGCLVRIMSNYTYIANNNAFASGSGAGGFYQTVQDEGVNLPQRLKLNFVGAGVTATDDVINNATIVTIPGSGSNFVSLTNAALQALITGGTIQPGTFYQVTNPLNASSVIVQGVGNSSITTLHGSGVFLNADYQKVGNYSSVAGFVANKGIWETLPPPAGVVAGDVVIYFNLHYKNITGVWGTAPNSDAVNWMVLAPSKTNGYIEEVDFVKYNALTNRVIYRADKRLNEVDDYTNSKGENTLALFQWGRDVVTYNKVYSTGLMLCTNSNATFVANEVYSGGTMADTTPRLEPGVVLLNIVCQLAVSSTSVRGSFSSNYISGNQTAVNIGEIESASKFNRNRIESASTIQINGLQASSTISDTYLIQNSKIQVEYMLVCNILKTYLSNMGTLTFFSADTWSNINVVGCEISDGNFVRIDGAIAQTYTNRKIRKDFSNWQLSIDMNGGSFALGTLTLDVLYDYIGIITLTNSTGKVIDKILNQPTNHKYIIKPADGQSVGLQHTLIAGAVAGNMVCDAPAPLNTITGRLNGCDFIEYTNSGNLCLRTNLVLLA